MARYAVIGEHFYNPPRDPSHSRLIDRVHSDPQGIDWNSLIAQQVYLAQLSQNTLDKASFDFYGTTRNETIPKRSHEALKLREAMRDRGVGDPFLHVLLPDQTQQDKRILIGAGREAFEQETGCRPQWFWAPETALDLETLQVLFAAGYRGAICAPEQIKGIRQSADNQPTRIRLPNGQIFILLPFDRPISSDLAFQDKSNADEFTWQRIVPRLDQLHRQSPQLPLVAWTDGETFGHHARWGELFLKHLLENSLPQASIALLGINQLPQVWEPNDYIDGQLRDRSAWSCPHGNLVRWHGACPCDGGHNGKWKEPFTFAIQNLNHRITALLDSELGSQWPDHLIQDFKSAFYYEGGRNSHHSLLAAKASALGANISCGTFFDNPQTSGRINMLFARQALEHVADAHHKQESDQLLQELLQVLSHGQDPHTGQSLDHLFEDILQPIST